MNVRKNIVHFLFKDSSRIIIVTTKGQFILTEFVNDIKVKIERKTLMKVLRFIIEFQLIISP